MVDMGRTGGYGVVQVGMGRVGAYGACNTSYPPPTHGGWNI